MHSHILGLGEPLIPYIHLGPLSIGTFGLMMWVAFLAAFFLLSADFKRRGFRVDPQNVVAFCAVAGIVGAKLYHVWDTPGEPFFRRTGFAWFGGFLAGLATLIFVALYYRIPLLQFLDACSPAAALGYAVGRIGCLTSGDGDYGIPTSLPWGMKFPPPALVPSSETCQLYGRSPDCAVHPTPLYEFLVGLLLTYALWKIGEKVLAGKMSSGTVLAAFLVLSGLARFLVEFIRINPRVLWGMSNAQTAGLCSLIAGIVLWIYVANSKQTDGAATTRN
jgi:phosphatidylglycerol:prolipoprotein diacylglycerol transferase